MFKSGASMIEHGKQTDRARQTDGTSGQNVCNLHETKPRPNLQGSEAQKESRSKERIPYWIQMALPQTGTTA